MKTVFFSPDYTDERLLPQLRWRRQVAGSFVAAELPVVLQQACQVTYHKEGEQPWSSIEWRDVPVVEE